MANQTDDKIREEIFGKTNFRAKFTLESVKDVSASAKAGYPIYRHMPHVLVRAEGERDGIAIEATADHKRQYQNEWRQFEERRAMKATSLLVLPTIEKTITAALHECGIHTVEQLADAEIYDPSPVQVVENNDPNDWSEPDESEPACKLPRPLSNWRTIAMRWLSLRDSIEQGIKPKLRIANGQFEFLEDGQ